MGQELYLGALGPWGENTPFWGKLKLSGGHLGKGLLNWIVYGIMNDN